MQIGRVVGFRSVVSVPMLREGESVGAISVARREPGRFSDGEVYVQINENVRGQDIFVIQPTCPPVNDHLMELLVMIDAFKRASARRRRTSASSTRSTRSSSTSVSTSSARS